MSDESATATMEPEATATTRRENRPPVADDGPQYAGKPKVLNVEVIPRSEDGREHDPQCYRIMDRLIAEHHAHLAEARICLAWRMGWKEDADGRLKLGQCKKAGDLERELHGYDFIILLNHEAWNVAEFTTEQMTALLDHELCHAQVTLDDEGEMKRDTAGRPVWRVRGHDVEEFVEIVGRHGCWTSGLEKLAQQAMRNADAPLFRREGPDGGSSRMWSIHPGLADPNALKWEGDFEEGWAAFNTRGVLNPNESSATYYIDAQDGGFFVDADDVLNLPTASDHAFQTLSEAMYACQQHNDQLTPAGENTASVDRGSEGENSQDSHEGEPVARAAEQSIVAEAGNVNDDADPEGARIKPDTEDEVIATPHMKIEVCQSVDERWHFRWSAKVGKLKGGSGGACYFGESGSRAAAVRECIDEVRKWIADLRATSELTGPQQKHADEISGDLGLLSQKLERDVAAAT